MTETKTNRSNDVITQTLIENLTINKQASLLSLCEANHYIKITMAQLQQVLDILLSSKEIIMHNITPTLSNDVRRDSGLRQLRDNLESLEKFVNSSEVTGKKTIIASSCKPCVGAKCNVAIFPLTRGLHLTELPNCYDICSQNVVLPPIPVGLRDLGLYGLFEQLQKYICTSKPVTCCKKEKCNKTNKKIKIVCKNDKKKKQKNCDDNTKCSTLSKSSKCSKSSKDKKSQICVDSCRESTEGTDTTASTISKLFGKSEYTSYGETNSNAESQESSLSSCIQNKDCEQDSTCDMCTDDIITVDACERAQYTKCVYYWKNKFEVASEKVASYIAELSKKLNLLKLSEEYIKEEYTQKVELYRCFDKHQ